MRAAARWAAVKLARERGAKTVDLTSRRSRHAAHRLYEKAGFHIRDTAVPPPGDDKRLAETVARIFARPLDRSRPLWELYVIHGHQTGYSAVLCSPAFIGLEEKPGRLDGPALAERLAYFIWNSEPDVKLRALGAKIERVQE